MSAEAAEQAWDRIDFWLGAHAPATFAMLHPPAPQEEIAAVQRRMGVTFPPDLVATLRRHDGADEDFLLPTHDGLLGTHGCEERSGFLRGMLAEVLDEDDDEEGNDGAYWHHRFVQFASYTITADGLTVDCRPGASFGAVGRFFDGSGTDFGHAPSLGAYLGDVADSLERGLPFQGGRTWPVVSDGVLEWDDSERAHPAWGDPAEPLPSPTTTRCRRCRRAAPRSRCAPSTCANWAVSAHSWPRSPAPRSPPPRPGRCAGWPKSPAWQGTPRSPRPWTPSTAAAPSDSPAPVRSGSGCARSAVRRPPTTTASAHRP